MSCLVNLRAVRAQLSANEKKIADFILDNSALIRDYSSQNLAASVGVSQSSVIKFSQKLNYRGFTDLKLAIHESVIMSEGAQRSTARPLAGHQHADCISQRLHKLKNDALITTMELNPNDRLVSAVKVLETSRRIQIIAQGASSMVARSFAGMLIQIGKSVIAETTAYIQLSSIVTLAEDDALFVLSYSGHTAQMVQIAQQAKQVGAAVISLTQYSANPIRSLADIRLFSVGREDNAVAPHIISTASQQHVIDVLFSMLLERDNKAKELLALNRKAVEET